MFFCTGCQNVQAIEPVALPVPVIPPATAGASDAANVPLDYLEGHGLDAVVGLAVQPDDDSVIENPAVNEDDKHPPLPISRASTPESEVEADADADAVNVIGEDTRMPVNRVASRFDESIYSQEFTLHKVASSKLNIRAYEGNYNTHVTIDTTEPVTLPIATLREVLDSIQPDPEKKRMGDTLMLMIASLFVSIILRIRD
jgi:hypothetical protein